MIAVTLFMFIKILPALSEPVTHTHLINKYQYTIFTAKSKALYLCAYFCSVRASVHYLEHLHATRNLLSRESCARELLSVGTACRHEETLAGSQYYLHLAEAW